MCHVNKGLERNKIIYLLAVFLTFIIPIDLTSADSLPSEVWVDSAYNSDTPGWNSTHFSTIQSAVNGIADGGKITVRSGTYLENISIKKSLHLVGEAEHTALIDGQGNGYTIDIRADDSAVIKIEDLKITNSGAFNNWAVNVGSNANVTVNNNYFLDKGICSGGTNCTITNNRIEGQGSIFLGSARNNTVSYNFLDVYYPGQIWLMGQSNNNTITHNTIIGNKDNASCTGIRSVMSDNNLYANNQLKNFRLHILLSCSDSNVIDSNTIIGHRGNLDESGGGIVLYRSDDNWITSNRISSVVDGGIMLFGGAVGNHIQANSVSDAQGGIELHIQSQENTIINNAISDSLVGIRLFASDNNTLFHNNLVDNTTQVYDDGDNSWSENSTGNFWSDYDGVDINGDGIGDSPMLIPRNTQDPYPLTSPAVIEAPSVPALVPLANDRVFLPATVIDNNVVWDGRTIDLTSRIVIDKGGKLALNNTTLNANFVNDFTFIIVNAGGTLEISNSRLISQGAGILAQKDSFLKIENSLLEGLGTWDGDGAVQVACDGGIIRNCVIEGGYSGIKVHDGASNIEFVGNTVRNVRIGLQFCCLMSQNNKIENNGFENIVEHAIVASNNFGNSRIVGNQFKNVWGEAIKLYDFGGNEIYDNVFENCPPQMEFKNQSDGSNNLTASLWAKAVLEVHDSPVTLVWKMVGADITPSGDQVISGYFYADPDDFAYGSIYNPELFAKIYIAQNGWCNMAFNHVTVDDVMVYSAHNYAGSATQTGMVTLSNRLVEHQYTGVAIDDTLKTTGDTPATSSGDGYTLSSGLWAKAMLQPPTETVNLIWKEVGTDTTPSGDQVVSGYFYASPEDFPYGSPYNPEVFVKVYIASNGWANIAFNHVTVDAVDISSAHNYAGAADHTGMATLDGRLVEHQYDGVGLQ